MTQRDRIAALLTTAFEPVQLEVVDESHQHAGHAGARAEGETHFRVRIIARAFAGRSRLERHRAVNAVLAEPLGTGVHALAIDARAPEEPPGRTAAA